MTGVERNYDCDCCGQSTPRALVTCSWPFGLETWACPVCRGWTDEDITDFYTEDELESWDRWRHT
jgi:hypothetical protein